MWMFKTRQFVVATVLGSSLLLQACGGWFRGDEPDCRTDDWRHDHRTFAVAVYYPGGV